MSDASVRAALRSDEPLVVIEAPAGCGKTYQGADYACEMAGAENRRLLILTHTHAACSVFAERTRGVGSRVEIRTIDSLIGQVAGAYHAGLGLPADAAAWARRTKDGYAHLAAKVASFLDRHPMVAVALARRYPVVVCDEHQDCSGDQHAIGMALHRQGARLRVFGDPMQRIYKDKTLAGGQPPADWESSGAERRGVRRAGYAAPMERGMRGARRLDAADASDAQGRRASRLDDQSSTQCRGGDRQQSGAAIWRLSARLRGSPTDRRLRART